MKLGLVDLDTSHPLAWLPIERELGHEVVGVWDGGAVHPVGYAEKFAAENGIPTVFSSLEEMAGEIDCAIVHSCNWDTHVEKVRPFVAAGKAAFIDKPFAGRLADLEQVLAWAAAGSRIYGGSSLRFAYETKAWLARPLAERGSPLTVVGGCGTDFYNYGIHAYSLVLGVMGPGVVSVRNLSESGQRRAELTWEDGRMGLVTVGPVDVPLPHYCTVVTERGVTHYQPSTATLYRSMLESTLPYLAGDSPPPVALEELLEAERCALAAEQSQRLDGKTVMLTDLSYDVGYDGEAFAAGYRARRYPGNVAS